MLILQELQEITGDRAMPEFSEINAVLVVGGVQLC